MNYSIALLGLFLLMGCTSIQVKPIADKSALKHVCIVENPAVKVEDFVSVLRDGFSRHNVPTSVVSKEKENDKSCETTLTYTALRSWDMSSYLSHAEIRLWKNGVQIGSADYHLKGKGGLSFNKWQSTKIKMDPVIDQLLAGNNGSTSENKK